MSKGRLWAGRAVSAIPVLVLLASGGAKLVRAAPVMKMLVGKYGYQKRAIKPMGAVEVLSAILYAVPQTNVLGAVLITGYLGGATATHVRENENFLAPVLLGGLAWLGIWLRDEQLAALTPWRQAQLPAGLEGDLLPLAPLPT